MELEWPSSPLGEICSKIGSGATPRGGDSVYKHDGVRLIRSQNVQDLHFTSAGLAHIGDTAAKQLEGVAVDSRDVLLNITGDSVARVCRAPSEGLPARVNQHVAILRPYESVLDSDFLCYSLASPTIKRHLLSLASAGATRKALTKAMLEDFKLRIPGLREQQAIAEVLGALDDKIESNRRVSNTLREVAASSLELILAENDCEEVQLGELFTKTIGGLWGSDEASAKEDMPIRCLRGIDVEALATGSIPDAPVRYVSSAAASKRELTPGTLLVEGSGSFCGRSGIFVSGWSELFDQPLLYSNFCKRLTPTVDLAYAVAAWFQLKSAFARGEVATHRTGSAFPNLDIDGLLAGIKVRVPRAVALVDWFALAELALDTTLQRETRRLELTRDTLLPRLISGKLRVQGFGEQAEAA